MTYQPPCQPPYQPPTNPCLLIPPIPPCMLVGVGSPPTNITHRRFGRVGRLLPKMWVKGDRA